MRYSRDRGRLLFTSQTLKKHLHLKKHLQVERNYNFKLYDVTVLLFEVLGFEGSLQVVFWLCVLPISRVAYCCLDFVMSAWYAWDALKLLALQSFFNLLSRTCHMQIRLIKMTKGHCLHWRLPSQLTLIGFVRSDEHYRRTHDGIAEHCPDFQFVSTVCHVIFERFETKFTLLFTFWKPKLLFYCQRHVATSKKFCD